MAKKMQAAFVENFGKPLVSMEVDVPTPGPGQILVKTEACGVCHADLHAATASSAARASWRTRNGGIDSPQRGRPASARMSQ